MSKLLIIADDLTGAADTAVKFAKKGISTFVLPDLPAEDNVLEDDFEVLVLNTESRHLEADSARERIKRAYRFGQVNGTKYCYKKTDSTLRGNIGAELEALLLAANKQFLAFAPAFPEQHRTTKNGIQFIGGKRIEKSAFVADILNPMAESLISSIIGRQSALTVKTINNVQSADWKAENGITVFDAESEEDLRKIVFALKEKSLLEITAGSAGLAEVLPEVLDFEIRILEPPEFAGPILIINGSLNAVSLKQVAEAEKNGLDFAEITPAHLFSKKETDRFIEDTAKHLQSGKNLLLRSVADLQELQNFQLSAEENGIERKNFHLKIAEQTGKIIAEILSKTNVKKLVVFGGDTLLGISRAMKWTGFYPFAEIFPGVVASKVSDQGKEFTIITKAGGFGSDDMLLKIVKELQ